MRKRVIVFLVLMQLVVGLFAEGVVERKPYYTVLEQKASFYSESLGVYKNYNIFFPPGYSSQQEYPVLYMLHGRTGDEDAWTTNDLFKKARELVLSGTMTPMIIVTPDVDNSAGFNWFAPSDTPVEPYDEKGVTRGQYEDYIVTDLVGHIDASYSTDARRESRYIGGCSLGGLAALHSAFLHTDLFSKVGGHSPALFLEDATDKTSVAFNGILYPDEELGSLRDPLRIAQVTDISNLSVYLDCGSEDDWGFFNGTAALYSLLQDRQVESQYYLNEGTHSREYWNAHLEDYLKFYAGSE